MDYKNNMIYFIIYIFLLSLSLCAFITGGMVFTMDMESNRMLILTIPFGIYIASIMLTGRIGTKLGIISILALTLVVLDAKSISIYQMTGTLMMLAGFLISPIFAIHGYKHLEKTLELRGIKYDPLKA